MSYEPVPADVAEIPYRRDADEFGLCGIACAPCVFAYVSCARDANGRRIEVQCCDNTQTTPVARDPYVPAFCCGIPLMKPREIEWQQERIRENQIERFVRDERARKVDEAALAYLRQQNDMAAERALCQYGGAGPRPESMV